MQDLPTYTRHRVVALFLSFALLVVQSFGLTTTVSAQSDERSAGVAFASASMQTHGVLVQWQSSDPDNLGFNVYRTQQGRRLKANGQIIAGAMFLGPRHINPLGDHSYSWYDPAGTSDSTYEIEAIGMSGTRQLSQPVTPLAATKRAAATLEASQTAPPSQMTVQSNAVDAIAGQIDDQWVVASQFGLKIQVKADGWYRVTQQQMAAAGFSPTVDIRNLKLYTDGREVAIRTSKDVDQFVADDFIEFWGRGIDIPTADTRIYYLIAGSSAGKRVGGDLHAEGSPDRAAIATTPATHDADNRPWLFLNPLDSRFGDITFSTAPAEATTTPEPHRVAPVINEEIGLRSLDRPANPGAAAKISAAAIATTTAKEPQPQTSVSADAAAIRPANPAAAPKRKRRVQRKAKRKIRRHRAHALASAAATTLSFDTTIQLKERYRNDAVGFSPVYYVLLINGDTENYFGRVITSSVTQSISAPNPELSADGPAKLEIALQGVLNQIGTNHTIKVDFNGTQVGSFTFGALDHLVRTINIPVNLLQNGPNTVKFTKTSSGEVCIVDYIKLTYPHALRADSNSLRFNLRSSQAATIDGFSAANVRLIDYTDPFSVTYTKPRTQATPAGYSIAVTPSTVPSKSKRQLYAAFDTQFDQVAGLSLHQPSTLNLSSNAADLVIIAHKSLIASAAPLVSLRQSQGLAVKVVDIDDVYDEFSYGVHGPQAIRDFLLRARTSWATAPRYVIFLGDADLDPRNYEGVGNFDLVPTKLVDATYNETASDDWLTDFNDDGIADIPTGRVPARTAAEATIALNKIVGYSPTNAPQTALLVADDPTGYYFNFETANDQVQALLPASMTVVRINKRTDGNAHQNIVNNLHNGLALINYSGHGNVNTWTGANIFNTTDAVAADNGNRLPLVLVMNCLNGYFQDPRLEGIAEGFLKAQNGGAFAVFASSGETIPDGQHQMSDKLYELLYGASSAPIALGDAIKIAKAETTDIDVRRTWIFFGDPSMTIR